MSSNMYFYFGIAQEWLLANGAKRKNDVFSSDNEIQPIKVKYFDDLPAGSW